MRLVPLVLLLACRADPDSYKPDTAGLGQDEDTAVVVDTADTDDSGVDTDVADADADGFTVEQGDCDDADAAIHPGAAEVCNGIDDDCDVAIDDGVLIDFWADGDQDGFGDPGAPLQGCDTAGGATNDDDCDDAHSAVYPGAPEVCDGMDSDCDGAVDEDGQSMWFTDADADGYGDGATGALGCDGAGRVADWSDCDDADATVNPGAVEACDGQDSDCDGAVDEDGQSMWFTDADGDGYGDLATGTLDCEAAGRVSDWMDCDDTDALVSPAGTETCDGVDQDCDGRTDEGLGTRYYIDYDGDGYGSSAYTYTACTQPSGYVADTSDCDDTEAAVNPDATEVCNDVDDDCDGTSDEPDAADATTWYADADGDGYGNAADSEIACDAPAGDVADGTDCDDTDPATYPGASERYDGVDDDCDGSVDDNAWIGTGADGALTVSGTTVLTEDGSNGRREPDAAAYVVTAISGSTVTVDEDADALAAGDEVLLVNLHGSDGAHDAVGTYELAWVASVAGDVVTLDDAVAGIYGQTDNSDLTDQAVVLQRVPQYTDVTVASTGLLTVDAWDGETGGILAFRATGTVTIAAGGTIVADELGYAGGTTGTAYNNDAYQGESYAGEGSGNHASYGGGSYNEVSGEWAANYGGGGANVTGGGGNHGGGATAGDSWTGGSATPPEAGDTYGEDDLSMLFFGSGGGGVWRGLSNPGPGGDGGGIVFIGASAIEADGAAAITSLGGTTPYWATGTWTYGAGGGAGGSVWLVADTLTLASDAVDASGGLGESSHIRAGGDGGYGRVRIDCNEVNGAACDTSTTGAVAEPDPEWCETP